MKKKLFYYILAFALIFGAAFYLFNAYKKPGSFVLVFPKSIALNSIEKDLLLLKKSKYNFLKLSELKQAIKSNITGNRKVAVFINRAPTNEFVTFTKKNNIKVAYVLSASDPGSLGALDGQEYGLHLSFAKPKPKYLKTGYISLNFDDGYKDVFEKALPLLRKEGMSATVFVIARTEIEESDNYLNATQLRGLQNEGWEIGSHSFSHENFKKLTKKEIAYSLSVSKGVLQDLSLYTRGFAFPFGEFDIESLQSIKDYYYYYRFTNDTYNLPTQRAIDGFTWEDSFSIDWVKKKLRKAKKNKVGVTFIFHDVSDNKRQYAVRLNVFKQILKEIKKSALPVYSNIALLGKPLFFRQENGKGLESQAHYVKRMRQAIKKQQNQLEAGGYKAVVIEYPDGVVTSGLIRAAKKEGFDIGFGRRIGFLGHQKEPLDLKTIYAGKNTVRKMLLY